MRPKLKVLPLESWMQDSWRLEDCLEDGSNLPVAPRLHRLGIYLQGCDCWFETPEGAAYTYPAATFKRSLELLQVQEISQAQVLALQAVVAQRLATKGQRVLLHRVLHARELKAVGRRARMSVLRLLAD